MNLQYTISNREEFFGNGVHKNGNAVAQVVMNFLYNVFVPVMEDYFWVYDIDHNIKHPILLTVDRGKSKDDLSIRQANYFSDVMHKIHTEAKKHVLYGCYISHASFQALENKYWINKQGDYMTKEEVSLIKGKYGELFFKEGAVLLMNSQRKLFLEQSQKGSFTSYDRIKICYQVVGKNLEIAWENNTTGLIRIYRLDGSGFTYECTDGAMIGDSHFKSGKIFDYNLTPEKTYYYTVVLRWKKGTLLETNWYNTALCRFSVMIPEENQVEEENTPLKEYRRSKEFELAKKKVDKEFRVDEEIDDLTVDMEKRKRLAKARNQFAQEFLSGKDASQLNEKDRQMYNELLELIDFQIRQFTIRR